LEVLRVSGYRQYRLLKARGKSPIRFSSLDFDGVLTVTEPDRLCQTLFDGIGPAKAFGCGLLLVRRI
jgi:CRISPR system Cascade subunit CasE